MSFVPIGLRDYVRSYLRNNRGADADQLVARLRSALDAYTAGTRCACGAPIWVLGSAETGNACFTCITGESDPSQDYELAGACDKEAMRKVFNDRLNSRRKRYASLGWCPRNRWASQVE
jgi:hypothetical protein